MQDDPRDSLPTNPVASPPIQTQEKDNLETERALLNGNGWDSELDHGDLDRVEIPDNGVVDLELKANEKRKHFENGKGDQVKGTGKSYPDGDPTKLWEDVHETSAAKDTQAKTDQKDNNAGQVYKEMVDEIYNLWKDSFHYSGE